MNDKMMMIMMIKLVVGGLTLSIISTYAPQMGLGEEANNCFWEDLDEVMRGISQTKKLLIGGNFNGHREYFRGL